MVDCIVSPAKAGVQKSIKRLDSGFHRTDGAGDFFKLIIIKTFRKSLTT
jgi:hypothetical protein